MGEVVARSGLGTARSEPAPDHAPRAAPDLVSRFARLPSTTVSDAMERLGAVSSQIHAIWPGAQVAGSALTVLTRAGDNLYIHRALEQAQEGDVLVVNGQGDLARALVGELLAAKARSRGVIGLVIDGTVRDGEGLSRMAMPTFARGLCPAGPYKDGPGRVNVPVAVGGVVVCPGDIVVADADGVVIVPLDQAESVAERAEALLAAEQSGG